MIEKYEPIKAQDILKSVRSCEDISISEWKIDLMAARQQIVASLLATSYHALGITPPTDDVIIIRAAQIAEKADVCNRDLKEAFDRAVDAKMEREIKTPITYGDINKAAILNATEKNKSVVGMWKNALPKIEDVELWSFKEVLEFAATHGNKEFNEMMHKRLTNDR